MATQAERITALEGNVALIIARLNELPATLRTEFEAGLDQLVQRIVADAAANAKPKNVPMPDMSTDQRKAVFARLREKYPQARSFSPEQVAKEFASCATN